MTRFFLPFCAAMLIATAPQARTVTTVNSHGYTVVTTAECDRADGARTCSRNAVITTDEGATATRDRLTVTTRDSITSTLSGTRLNGHSYSRTTVVTR